MDVVKEFSQHLTDSGLAPSTIQSYLTDVRQFLEYLRDAGVDDPSGIQRFHVTGFKSRLVSEGYSIASANKKVNSLNSFNRFLVDAGTLPRIVVHPGRDRVRVAAGSEREVEVFTEDEVARILSHVNDQGRESLRNRLIVHLLLYTGVRVGELVGIRLADVDFLTSTLRVTGKGGKYREIPLRHDLAEVVREYVRTERRRSRHRGSPYLLLSQRSPRMHRDAVNRVVRRIGRELGIEAYPHKFRHTFCTLLLRKGVPITTVSRLAGHSSIQTTSAFYVATSRRDKAEAVNLL